MGAGSWSKSTGPLDSKNGAMAIRLICIEGLHVNSEPKTQEKTKSFSWRLKTKTWAPSLSHGLGGQEFFTTQKGRPTTPMARRPRDAATPPCGPRCALPELLTVVHSTEHHGDVKAKVNHLGATCGGGGRWKEKMRSS